MSQLDFKQQFELLNLNQDQLVELATGKARISINQGGYLFYERRIWTTEATPHYVIYGGVPGRFEGDIRDFIFEEQESAGDYSVELPADEFIDSEHLDELADPIRAEVINRIAEEVIADIEYLEEDHPACWGSLTEAMHDFMEDAA
ncbi:MAG: hypothetical protein N0C90_13000 [Candidatus Thiodiazotropha endolucinida]|nr:hypothetical protein [Candidatus Thiodiazotropha taylori]MCW4262279.1 hypothetical protein [Candidatus Thiodiazotropha endolucinida]